MIRVRVEYTVIGVRKKLFNFISVSERHNDRAHKNHGQSLEILNTRGGIEAKELLAIVLDQTTNQVKCDNITSDEAFDCLNLMERFCVGGVI